jgi:hypothetical protein
MKAHTILTNGDVITTEFLTSIYCDDDGIYKTYTEAEVKKLTKKSKVVK